MTTLASKLAEVASECAYVRKDAKNTGQGYRYASAEAVLKKANESLTKRGIAIGSEAEVKHFGVSQEKNSKGHDTWKRDAVVKLTLVFMDGETGEQISVSGLGEGQDNGDKAVMKANTAALKYALANAFLISWGDDPEADSGTDGKEETEDDTYEKLKASVEKAKKGKELEKLKPEITTFRRKDKKRGDELVALVKEKENG